MNRTNLLLGGLIVAQVAWAGLAYKQSQAGQELARQLDLIEKGLGAEKARISALKSENEMSVNRLQDAIKALGKLPSSQEVAAAMTSSETAPIFGAVVDRLKGDGKFREAVKGERGPAAPRIETKEVVSGLLDCCTKPLVESVWRAGRPEILQHPNLLADIAQQVYATYGSALKGADGRDGRSPSVEDVTKGLATDVGFAQLVADMRR